jgi:hypothetical protein
MLPPPNSCTLDATVGAPIEQWGAASAGPPALRPSALRQLTPRAPRPPDALPGGRRSYSETGGNLVWTCARRTGLARRAFCG